MRAVAVTDPVDARLLVALAEQGKVAVHELAARLSMDPREVAYRLVALSGSGLPLLVGVECDPNGIRAAVANAPAWGHQPVHGAPSGAYHVQGTPSGPYNTVQGAPSGAYNPAQGTPSAAYNVAGYNVAGYNVAGAPSGPYGNITGQQPPGQQPPGYRPPQPPPQGQPPPRQTYQQGPPSRPFAAAPGPQPQQPGPPPPNPQPAQPRPATPADPVISTWGPPQSSSWARGDQVQPVAQQPTGNRAGRTGDVLQTQGLEGEQLGIQLLEVQDPADFLFGAAGYRLDEGERAVVVHTEITNHGSIPFASLPDNYLELVTSEGVAITKAPVSLSSRPPHRIGVRPGETAGGHTVYVVAESTRIASVRWSARPEVDEHSVSWSIED